MIFIIFLQSYMYTKFYLFRNDTNLLYESYLNFIVLSIYYLLFVYNTSRYSKFKQVP